MVEESRCRCDASPEDNLHPCPDPIEAEDNPDQQALMAEFIAGLARESDNDFKGLS